ncbi:MAG: hypothetical protein JW719_04035 [Pirellulales bacterium]|nr:hypothetical protein [Pirellulales bacterium]
MSLLEKTIVRVVNEFKKPNSPRLYRLSAIKSRAEAQRRLSVWREITGKTQLLLKLGQLDYIAGRGGIRVA